MDIYQQLDKWGNNPTKMTKQDIKTIKKLIKLINNGSKEDNKKN